MTKSTTKREESEKIVGGGGGGGGVEREMGRWRGEEGEGREGRREIEERGRVSVACV